MCNGLCDWIDGLMCVITHLQRLVEVFLPAGGGAHVIDELSHDDKHLGTLVREHPLGLTQRRLTMTERNTTKQNSQ